MNEYLKKFNKAFEQRPVEPRPLDYDTKEMDSHLWLAEFLRAVSEGSYAIISNPGSLVSFVSFFARSKNCVVHVFSRMTRSILNALNIQDFVTDAINGNVWYDVEEKADGN